jgi:hypothetical protein
MAKVKYIAPGDIDARLLKLKPYRDQLCQLKASYRFSSAEYRRLCEATDAIDNVCALLAGRRDLLCPQLEPSRWKPLAG